MDESTDTTLRHRQVKSNTKEIDKQHTEEKPKLKRHLSDDVFKPAEQLHLDSGSYWLTRVLFLRCLGFIYFVAFLVAYNQNQGLLGSKGLLPVKNYMQRVKSYGGDSKWQQFLTCPSILLFVEENEYDNALNYVALCGLILSAFVTVNGGANIIIMALLWIMYHSLVNVGQVWYGFGWESQLLETGFLAIFFCPLFNIHSIPEKTPPSKVVVYGYRWLIFRIMIGAGLIKIRGDQCWRDLTCMDYHYQTQPVPNPLSYYLHRSPPFIHRLETAGNHIVELVIPFLLFWPRRGAIFAGCVQTLFQIILILSGNLSFLNWLTILPSLCCFDDKFLSNFCPGSPSMRIAKLQAIENNRGITKNSSKEWGNKFRSFVHFLLFCLIAYLSVPVVNNILSKRQAMNRSFDSFRLVNTYGAFGSVTKTRTEVILQGTYSDKPLSSDAVWLEYDFKCKPGNMTSQPCIISPYHYRLDWLMWFAAFQSYDRNPWFVHMVAKLLKNDELVTGLIKHNPFYGKDPPKYIRAQHYKYQYARPGGRHPKNWWKRKLIGEYLPAVNLHQLKKFLKANGFPMLPP